MNKSYKTLDIYPDDNKQIYLSKIEVACQKKILKKFNKEKSVINKHNTYRELLVGAHLRDNNWQVRYDCKVENRTIDNPKTPDWCLFSDEGKIIEIIDVVSIHLKERLKNEMHKSIKLKKVWTHSKQMSIEDIARNIDKKAGAYKELSAVYPYTVAVYADFLTLIEPEQIDYILNGDSALFKSRVNLCGLIFFIESNQQYQFYYFKNENSTLKSLIFD